MIGRQNARSDFCLAAEQISDERFAVGGIREGLPELPVRQNRIFEIEAAIGEVRSGAIRDRQIGPARKNGNDIRRERGHFEISGALAEFQSAHDGVRDDAEAHACKLRRAAKVIRIALDDNLFVLRLLDEAERTGANRVPGEIRAGVGGNDACSWTNEIPGE